MSDLVVKSETSSNVGNQQGIFQAPSCKRRKDCGLVPAIVIATAQVKPKVDETTVIGCVV